jgi:membrane-associated protein
MSYALKALKGSRMQIIKDLVDFVLHLDRHLAILIAQVGIWTYLPLFFVIFLETGFVITPFLPGDSLLFAAGALASLPQSPLNIFILYVVLAAAAIAGDTANYWIGYMVGPRVFTEKVPFLKKEYLMRAHEFYEKHGNMTIFLARFVPFIRTFAPFVAGIGRMSYGHFISYNVFGGLIWAALFTFGGFFFGNIPFVKNNFSLVVIAIILISLVPAGVEIIRSRRKSLSKSSPEIG